MKKLAYLTVAIFLISSTIQAQVSLSSAGTSVDIDFESNVSGVSSGSFTGAGFTPTPSLGQLDSDAWELLGFSSGALNFGGTGTSGDYGRGVSSGGVSSGGMYAFVVATGDTACGFQATGSDFTPGSITLKIENNTGATVDSVLVSYDLYINNNEDRANFVNPFYSTDNVLFTGIVALNDTSQELSGGSVSWVTSSKTITIPVTLMNNDDFYFKWETGDVSGGGSRDEFALDNISITGLTASPTAFTASINMVSNVSCNGLTDGSATATTTNGTAPFTYLWSNGNTTSTSTNLAAGTFTVTVSDALAATATASVAITEPSQLSPSTIITDVTTTGGSNGAIDLTVTGGTSPYTYFWSNGAGTEDIMNLVAGTYTVTISDANGCDSIVASTVNNPPLIVINLSLINVSCNGLTDGSASTSISGGAAPYTYNWSPSIIGAAGSSVNNLAAGNYSLTVTDANGVNVVNPFTINEPTAISLSFAVTNASAMGAADGAIDLTVSGGVLPYSYLWNSLSTSEDLTGLIAGAYCVTVTDANGCTSLGCDTVREPGTLPQLVITEIMYNAAESGIDTTEYIELHNAGTSPINLNNYSFSQGVSHTFGSHLISSGQYFVIAVDSSAFRNRYGFNADAIWTSGGLSNGGEDITILDDFGRTVDSVDYNTGSPWPSGSAAGQANGGGASIELMISGSDNNIGGNWTASGIPIVGQIINGLQVFGTPRGSFTVGLNEVQDDITLRVFPNPTNDVISILVNRTIQENEELQLINIKGEIIHREKLNVGQINLDLSRFSNGTYFVKLGEAFKTIVKTD